jgi:uncharacterized membrane protein YjgN (DUF898 family)
MQPYPPVVSAPGPAFVPPPQERELRFEFTGSAKEYFRIWIVNTLLTIVTLGVYSAWAKVRTKQYFYRHTFVEGTSFEYLADPLKVLKGRIIAAVALGLLFGSQHYSLTLYICTVVVFVLATPWVLVKALAFNARNSAYRTDIMRALQKEVGGDTKGGLQYLASHPPTSERIKRFEAK